MPVGLMEHTPAYRHLSIQSTRPQSSMQPLLSLRAISGMLVPSPVAQKGTQRADPRLPCWGKQHQLCRLRNVSVSHGLLFVCLHSQLSSSLHPPGVLFISPNNSPQAIAHLLTVTNASHVIVQHTPFPSAIEALAHLADTSSVPIVHQPLSDVFGPDARVAHPDKTRWDSPLGLDAEYLLPIAIIHSSGLSVFPKPIIATNKSTIENSKLNFGLTSLTTLPLYHVRLPRFPRDLLY